MTSEDQLNRRVFVVVHSAVLPRQDDTNGPCVVMWPANRETAQLTLETVPPANQNCEYQWRRPTFKMIPGVVVGTIDELVEHYREKLTQAAKLMISSDALPYKDVEKSIENAEVLGYQPGVAREVTPATLGDAITLPWLEEATKRMKRLIARTK